MNTLTGIQIEGNLITFDLTTELLSNELKGQTPQDFGIAQTNKLEDEMAIAKLLVLTILPQNWWRS